MLFISYILHTPYTYTGKMIPCGIVVLGIILLTVIVIIMPMCWSTPAHKYPFSLLKPGDIIFSESNTIGCRLIKILTFGGKFSHVSIVNRVDDTGIYVVHCMDWNVFKLGSWRNRDVTELKLDPINTAKLTSTVWVLPSMWNGYKTIKPSDYQHIDFSFIGGGGGNGRSHDRKNCISFITKLLSDQLGIEDSGNKFRYGQFDKLIKFLQSKKIYGELQFMSNTNESLSLDYLKRFVYIS